MVPQLLLFAVVLQSLISCCTGPFGRSAQSPVMFHRGGNRDMEKRDLSKPQQRVGVETCLGSYILLGSHPASAQARIHCSGARGRTRLV